ADAVGNVVRTTDSVAATVNQYAYTSYGRSLDTADSAPDSDPYRFVGSQGVMLELPGLHFMRARYYSTDAGVFLATDPVKNIGPGWKPERFTYSGQNPLRYSDPDGRFFAQAMLAIGVYYAFEQTKLRAVNELAGPAEFFTQIYAGAATAEDAIEEGIGLVPGGDIGA
ncbi:MAG: hypothetical protein KJT03_25040, partial [Verrucomicrobiae bacterium]|nr:hypothetical protein [Verrucomicrobiae bacterium]